MCIVEPGASGGLFAETRGEEECDRGWIMLGLHHLAGDPVAYLCRAREHASRLLLPAPSR